jgi:AraC-like DNA-binding protein
VKSLFSSPVQILWVARFDYASGGRLEPHFHDFYQAIAILSGQGQVKAGHESCAIQAPMLLFLPPGTEHSLEATRRRVPTLDIKFRIHAAGLGRAASHLPRIWVRPPECVTQLLELVLEEGIGQKPLFRERAEVLLAELIIELLRATEPKAKSSAAARAPHGPSDPIVRALLDELGKELGLPWDGELMERRLGYSYRHLSERCKAVLGASPRELLQRLRLEHARELLAYSDLSVSAIAERTGFATSQHFHRLFRAAMSMPPSEYRKRVQSKLGVGVTFVSHFGDTQKRRR